MYIDLFFAPLLFRKIRNKNGIKIKGPDMRIFATLDGAYDGGIELLQSCWVIINIAVP